MRYNLMGTSYENKLHCLYTNMIQSWFYFSIMYRKITYQLQNIQMNKWTISTKKNPKKLLPLSRLKLVVSVEVSSSSLDSPSLCSALAPLCSRACLRRALPNPHKHILITYIPKWWIIHNIKFQTVHKNNALKTNYIKQCTSGPHALLPSSVCWAPDRLHGLCQNGPDLGP